MKDYVINGKVVNITLDDGKVVKAETQYLEKMCDNLEIDMDEAVMTWLEDEEYIVNDEQRELTDKAKEHKIAIGAKKEVAVKKTQKERVVKINPNKEMLIAKVAEMLGAIDGVTDIVVENKGKIVTFKLADEDYKFDLVQKRKAKTKVE